MTLVQADVPMSGMTPLVLPHSSRCRNPDHPTTHCYREAELETRVVDHLKSTYPRISVTQQEIWKGIGRPDIVCRVTMGEVTRVSIIELKCVPIRFRELNQLWKYVFEARKFWAARPEPYLVTGVLAGFCIRDSVLATAPEWFGYWPMDVVA